jgi:hypothetical protein
LNCQVKAEIRENIAISFPYSIKSGKKIKSWIKVDKVG